MDVHSPERRSYNMSKIKGKNTRPEMIVRKWLWRNGYRYRLHKKDLPGKPDIVLAKYRTVVFVHGCFWHQHTCRYFKWPNTNKAFWEKKISDTVQRDKKNYAALFESGWKCFIIWECQVKGKEPEVFDDLKLFLEEKGKLLK